MTRQRLRLHAMSNVALLVFGTMPVRVGAFHRGSTPHNLASPLSLPHAGAFPRNPPPKSLSLRPPPEPTSTQIEAWPLNKDPKGVPPEFPVAAARMGITAAATVLTWFAHSQKRCSNVLASASVTLLCSLLKPGLGQAAMCGTFAGMSSTVLVPNLKYALSLGALTAALFEVLIHNFNLYLGVGGRLGATAFLGTNALGLLQGIPTGVNLEALAFRNAPFRVMMAFHALGSVATIALREASDDSNLADPVRAAAMIGMVAALFVGLGGFSEMGALAVYGGAFVGMSLPSRLMSGVVPGKNADAPTTPTIVTLLASFAVAGLLGGLVHALATGWGWWSGGWGGKAGFYSFIGVLLYRALSKLAR